MLKAAFGKYTCLTDRGKWRNRGGSTMGEGQAMNGFAIELWRVFSLRECRDLSHFGVGD